MKKSRILSLIALLVCAVMLFASCSGTGAAKNASAKKAFGSLEFWSQPENTELTTAKKVSSLKGSVNDSEGPLVLLKNDSSTYTVYNMETETTVGSYSESDDIDYYISLYSTENDAYFYTAKKITADESETFLYDDDGNQIASVKQWINPAIELDLVKFGDNCYKFNSNGTWSKAFSSVNDLPDLFAASSKYYYATSDDDKTLMVLDGKMNIVSSFTFPSYAASPISSVLNNGNIFIQYTLKLSDDAEKYDLIDENATKWSLVQGVITAKSGALKKVKTGYYYNGFIARDIAPTYDDFELQFNKGIVNVGGVYQIKEKRVDKTPLYASIGNNGKVKSILNRFSDGQEIWEPIENTNGKVRVTDLLGREYLYTSKGTCVGEITEMDVFTNNYMVDTDGQKIYSYELKELYGYGAEDYSYVGKLGADLIFKYEGSTDSSSPAKYYKYGSNGIERLNDNDTTFSLKANRYYELKSSGLSSTFAYYNASGNKLIQTEFELSSHASYNGKILMRGYDSDAESYVFFLFK